MYTLPPRSPRRPVIRSDSAGLDEPGCGCTAALLYPFTRASLTANPSTTRSYERQFHHVREVGLRVDLPNRFDQPVVLVGGRGNGTDTGVGCEGV